LLEHRTMTKVRLFISLFVVLGSAALAAGCEDDNTESQLHVENLSDFAIVEIHVTSVGSSTWGSNLLDGNPLEPGESLLLGVDCGTYDALLVDEAGVDCQVNDLDLCLNNADWVIRNDTCTVFGAAKAARAAAAAAAAAPPSTPAATAAPDMGAR